MTLLAHCRSNRSPAKFQAMVWQDRRPLHHVRLAVFLSGQSLNKQMTQRAKCSACLLAPERIWELYRAPQKIGHDRTHEWITMPRTWLIARVSWRRGSHEASRRSCGLEMFYYKIYHARQRESHAPRARWPGRAPRGGLKSDASGV